MILQRKHKKTMAWQGGSTFILQLLTQKRNLEEPSLFEITVVFCFPNACWRYFWPPDHKSDFGHPLLAYEITGMFYHPFFARWEEGKVARRDASGWIQGRIPSTRSQAGLQTEAMQTFPQSDPDWKKLGVGWANVGAGPPSSRAPDWSPHGVPLHLRYRKCHILHGVGSLRSELRTHRFSFQLCHKFHMLPWAGKPNPHASLPVNSALPICPSLLIKCWTLKVGALWSYGDSSSMAW